MYNFFFLYEELSGICIDIFMIGAIGIKVRVVLVGFGKGCNVWNVILFIILDLV